MPADSVYYVIAIDRDGRRVVTDWRSREAAELLFWDAIRVRDWYVVRLVCERADRTWQLLLSFKRME